MVIKRRLPAMAVGLALMALSGCVAAENKTAADFRCPTIVPPLPGLDVGIPPSYEVSIQDHDFWQRTMLHGSNLQLDLLIQDGIAGQYGKVDHTWVREAKQVQKLRRANNCADVPNLY